jgi:hypothetical protein
MYMRVSYHTCNFVQRITLPPHSRDFGKRNDGFDCRYAEESDFQTPLDEVDAAARILGERTIFLLRMNRTIVSFSYANRLNRADPVVTGVTSGECPYGQFLKDYFPTEW